MRRASSIASLGTGGVPARSERKASQASSTVVASNAPPTISSAAQTGTANASRRGRARGQEAECEQGDDGRSRAEAGPDRDPDQLPLDLDQGELDLELGDRPRTVDDLLRGPADAVSLHLWHGRHLTSSVTQQAQGPRRKTGGPVLVVPLRGVVPLRADAPRRGSA